MGKKKNKSKSGAKQASRKDKETPPEQEPPVNNGRQEPPLDNGTPVDATNTVLLQDLKLDELRKECVKLGLVPEGEKPKKEFCISKIAVHLHKYNFDSVTFKFSPKGQTKFPPIILGKSSTPNGSEDDTDSSTDDSEESDDSSASEKEEEAKRRSKSKRKQKKTKRSSKESPSTHVILPPGWHVLTHPATGEPCGMINPAGKCLSLDSGSPSSTPTTPAETPTVDLTGAPQRRGLADNISEAARLLGAPPGNRIPSGTRIPPTDYSQSRPRNPPGINSRENADYCGMSVPGFMYNQDRDKENSTYNRKLVSGKYSNGKKEVIRKALYANHGIDSTLKPQGVNYEDMTWEEFGNGYTALVLAECDENTSPRVVNMLKHINRLFAYGMFASLPSVKELDSGYMLGIENMTQDWSDGKRLNEYHDRQLHSLKLATKVDDNNKKNPENKKNSDKSSDNDKNKRCSKDWIKSQNICFGYQNDTCDEVSGHDDGNGNMLTHCCAWCAFKDKGFQAHNNPLCENKSNPFRQSRQPDQIHGRGVGFSPDPPET